MAKKIKIPGLTDLEIEELARKGENVWVVYRYGKMRQFPASIFVNSERKERIFFTNYWLAYGASLRRRAKAPR